MIIKAIRNLLIDVIFMYNIALTMIKIKWQIPIDLSNDGIIELLFKAGMPLTIGILLLIGIGFIIGRTKNYIRMKKIQKIKRNHKTKL